MGGEACARFSCLWFLRLIVEARVVVIDKFPGLIEQLLVGYSPLPTVEFSSPALE